LLESQELDFDHVNDLFQKYCPIIIIDEHIAVIEAFEDQQRPYEPWLAMFVKLNGLPRPITLFLGASSHARFELNYLKNGMNYWKYFCCPLPSKEATSLLNGCFQCNINDQKSLELVLGECNNVPRELLHFSQHLLKTPTIVECLHLFRKNRVEEFKLSLDNFYQHLNPEQKSNLLNTLSKMFRIGTGVGGVSELTGFIDLSLCYRTEQNLRPLNWCPPAMQALYEHYVSTIPQQAQFQMWMKDMQDGTISGADFENLVWALLLHDSTIWWS